MVCAWVGKSFSHPLRLRPPYESTLVSSFVALLLILKPHSQKWVISAACVCDSKIESFMHSEAINEPILGEIYLLAFC